MPPSPAETLPEWAFDAPSYFRPPIEALPKPLSEASDDYPVEYYVSKRVILLDRPQSNVPSDRVPRIAVWWTNTHGEHWARAGYFGLGQTHFPFVAGDDGDYGIRFIGPGIRESLTEETIPHRIYHLDRTPPVVTITIEPHDPPYNQDEIVILRWAIEDANLDNNRTQISVCWSWENPGMLEELDADSNEEARQQWPTRLWRPMPTEFEDDGTLAFALPPHAAGEVLQFQVRAKDRSGNYGRGFSALIPINALDSSPATRPQ